MDKQISKSTMAVLVWVVCLVCLLICGIIFWALGQENSSIVLFGYPMVGFVSLTAIGYLISTPLTSASINADRAVTFTWRYLLRCERKVFHASSLAEPKLVELVDSDGDSHWSVQLVLPDNSVFLIAEYGVPDGGGKNEKVKQRCEAKRAQFVENLSALGFKR